MSGFWSFIAYLALIWSLASACEAHRVAILACVNLFIIVRSKSTFLDTSVIKLVNNTAYLELILTVPALSASLGLILARLTQLTACPTLISLLINIESVAGAFIVLGST